MNSLWNSLQGGLVVSCQAPNGSPLRNSDTIARIASAAELGGAVGLRINGREDVAAARRHTSLPIIGLHKTVGPRRNLITPRADLAAGLLEAGADIVAVEATEEMLGEDWELIQEIADLGTPVMADVSTLSEGLRAAELGADLIGTTLSGYTPYSRLQDPPDIELVADLSRAGLRVVAEGRYRTPADVARAFDAGAGFVVVGGAITDPISLTQRFAAAARRPGT